MTNTILRKLLDEWVARYGLRETQNESSDLLIRTAAALKPSNSDHPSERFFFDTDCDSHWYLIPETMREQWNDLNFDFNDEEDTDKFLDLFGSYRISGPPNCYSFTDPQEGATA